HIETMLPFFLSYLLLALLSSSSFAYACRASVWAVGLSANQTVEDHLLMVNRSMAIQERRLEINGYTAFIPNDDKATLKAIRRDPSVGYVVKVPQDYFRKFDQHIAAGPDGIHDEVYEYKLRSDYQWGRLQRRDPEIIESMYVRSRDIFINLITQLDPTAVSLGRSDEYGDMYTLSFRSEEQERKSLPLIYSDHRVEASWPDRCHDNMNKFFHRIDGEDIPSWEDTCVWGLGYRQWDKAFNDDTLSKGAKSTFDRTRRLSTSANSSFDCVVMGSKTRKGQKGTRGKNCMERASMAP
ncbi:unnamed protein product, partial [Aureobasidium vineae]